jgi:hypothetical protein
MALFKINQSLKPIKYSLPLEARRLLREHRPMGRVGPVAKIVDEAMLLGILVNIDNQLPKISIGRRSNRDPVRR